MFGGTTSSRSRKRPTGTRSLSETPLVWMADTADPPIVTVTKNGLFVLIGQCGATHEQVEGTVRGSVPDDITWRWPGAYIGVRLEQGRVDLWTDLGALPVYVWQCGDGQVIWSTSARTLASFDSTLDLDPDAVSEFIKGGSIEHSLFAGVHRLPPGHHIRLRRGRWEAKPVWEPRPSSSSTARRLRRALEGAVATRVDATERPTCDLSGGLDSTSLALLAARRLAPVARTITGTTLHPEGITHGGDLDYAKDAARVSGLDHVWIGRDSSHAPYRELTTLPPTDEPPVSTLSATAFTAQMRRLSSHGSDIHMSGDGGDALLLTPPIHLVEMLERRPLRALGAASRFAQVRRISLRRALEHARSSGPEATGLNLPSRTHQRIVGTLIDGARSARADVELAASLGVRLDNPFFDAQVIDSYLAIPVEEMPEPARYKPILVQAMHDLLPASIRGRTTKATTTADHYEGLRRSLPEVSALLDGYLAQTGLIEVSAARSRLRTFAAGAGDLGPIEPVIAFEAWWRALKPVPWKEGDPP